MPVCNKSHATLSQEGHGPSVLMGRGKQRLQFPLDSHFIFIQLSAILAPDFRLSTAFRHARLTNLLFHPDNTSVHSLLQ